MNIEIRQKGEETSWEALAELMHEAFQERLEQGLHFTCSYLTAEQLEKQCANSIVLLGIDADDHDSLAGTVSIKMSPQEKNTLWAYHFNLAVRPKYKHCGVASLLFSKFQEIAKEHKCYHIISDTAVGAKSSVQWHLKNGFKIIALHSFCSTNYYSYIFRKQLKPHMLWSNSFYCRVRYYLMYCLCHLYRQENGNLTKLGELYIKMRGGLPEF